jgi:hypothetical protein
MLLKNILNLSRALLKWPPIGMPFDEKIRIITLYARARTPAFFVETGTLRGDTLAAVREEFSALLSIELDHTLYKAAIHRFKGDNKISIYEGDSSTVLNYVLAKKDTPVVFWLDGHYSGSGTAKGSQDCPILRELDAIIARGNHRDVVLVDDARLYGRRHSYPKLTTISKKLQEAFPNCTLTLHTDIACFMLGRL